MGFKNLTKASMIWRELSIIKQII